MRAYSYLGFRQDGPIPRRAFCWVLLKDPLFSGAVKKNFFRNLTNPISPLFCKWLIFNAKFGE